MASHSKSSAGSRKTAHATVGTRAPDFTLPCTAWPDAAERQVSLADYRDRWLVLLFYPRDFSMVCPTELTALSVQYEEFVRRDCDLLGISTDSVASHQKWIATPRSQGGLGGLAFPLASDESGASLPGLRRAAGTAERGPARTVHHRSQRRAAISGRAQPERWPPQRGSSARARRAANRRAVPRKLEPRRTDARSHPHAGTQQHRRPISHRKRDRQRHVRRRLSRARFDARTHRGAQGVSARPRRHAADVSRRSPVRRRAESSQRLHNLRGGRERTASRRS